MRISILLFPLIALLAVKIHANPSEVHFNRLGSNSEDSLLSSLDPDGDGWAYIDRIGWFQVLGNQWIFHPEHGYLFLTGPDTSNLYLYDYHLDCWLWTSDGLYPWLFKYGDNVGWYSYYSGNDHPNSRWFYRADDGVNVFEQCINGSRDVTNPFSAEFVTIPAGEFQMGDHFEEFDDLELPVHTVLVSEFQIQNTEVTLAQLASVMNWAIEQGLAYVDSFFGNIDIRNAEGYQQLLLEVDIRELYWDGSKLLVVSGRESLPCGSVSWYGAMAYCNYLSDQEGLDRVVNFEDWSINMESGGYRLPTEAEWEKSARGGQVGNRFPWGNSISYDQANYKAWPEYEYDLEKNSEFHVHTNKYGCSPIGSFPANDYGLYEIAGNKWEWCVDYFYQYPNESSALDDLSGPATGGARTLRGGSAINDSGSARVSARRSIPPYKSKYSYGFRPARRQIRADTVAEARDE